MIATVHLLAGATLATKNPNVFLGLFLAFVSHYFLDFIPHIEYISSSKANPDEIKKNLAADSVKVAADFLIGGLILLFISKNKSLAFLGGFLAILPDFDNIFLFFPKLLKFKLFKIIFNFHLKVHFFSNKKIPVFVRILSQVLVILISIYFLRLQ
ncbi:MAG: hypothetical protein PHF44_02310 [Candidatus Pacebacteria bacterium]|nr:hypothetical protein [Candidatus Paceibacterota bacterium]